MADYGDRRRERWRRHVDRDADRRRAAPQTAWTRTARRLGLVVRTESPNNVVFDGHYAGCAIEVTRVDKRRLAEWTLVVSRADVDPLLKLTRETAMTRARKVLGQEDVLTGAPGFDFLVYIEGDAPQLVAALDDRTRQFAYRLIEHGATISGGSLRLVRRTALTHAAPEHLRRDIVEGAKLLRRLANATDDVRTNLIQNSRDEDPRVRVTNLDMLRKTYPYDVGQLDWPLEPHAPHEVAWRIALMSSRADAASLARWADDTALDVKTRGAFLARLDDLLPSPRALDALLAHLDGDLAGAATRRLLARADDPSVVRNLDRKTTALLFERATNPDRVRLADTLGEVGVAAALDVLVEYSSGFLLPRAVKDAARRAVTRIDRQTRTHRGHLSVADDAEAGTLALSGEQGRLTLTDRET